MEKTEKQIALEIIANVENTIKQLNDEEKVNLIKFVKDEFKYQVIEEPHPKGGIILNFKYDEPNAFKISSKLYNDLHIDFFNHTLAHSKDGDNKVSVHILNELLVRGFRAFGKPSLIDLLYFIITNEIPEHIEDRIQIVIENTEKIKDYSNGMCSCFSCIKPIEDEGYFGCEMGLYCNDGNGVIKPLLNH